MCYNSDFLKDYHRDDFPFFASFCIHNNTMSLFGSSPATAASSANPTQGDISKDVTVANPPEDSISDLAFSPVADYLAVSSWDKKVRIYEIDAQGNSQGKALFEHEGPVLSCAWSKVRYSACWTFSESSANSLLGWHESRWRRRRQSCPHD